MPFLKSFFNFLSYGIYTIVYYLLIKLCVTHMGDKEIYQPFLSIIGILCLTHILFYFVKISFEKFIN
jgi:hypothetical protein